MLNRPAVLIQVSLVIVVLLLGYLSLLIWRRRKTCGVRYLLWILLSALIWCLFYLLEISSGELDAKLFWSKAKYLGIVTIPVFWFLFVTEYLGYRQLWPYSNLVLFAVPVFTLVAVWTNPWHGSFFRLLGVQDFGSGTYLQVKHGLFFWLHTAYSNLLLGVSLVAMIHALVRSHRFYRMQMYAMIAAALFPWIGNVFYLTHAMPGILLDPTPFAFLLTAIFINLGTSRFRWLDLVPVARVVVLETMRDGVIVVDDQRRILDLNPAAADLLGMSPKSAIGESMSTMLPRWAEIADAALWTGDRIAELKIDQDEGAKIYEVRVSSLDLQGSQSRHSGHVLMLHDVTTHVRALQEREQLIHDLDAFAHMVAHDIKNPVGTVVTAANLLANEYEDLPREEIKMLAQVFQRAGDKAENIISNLLVLAGVQKMQLLDLSPLNMEAIITEALRQLEQPISRSEAQIHQPDRWPAALGHESWVEQVWVNYISNAIKYGGRPPEITLGADKLTVEGRVRFWVQDNGDGLDDIEVQRIFEPFTRLTEMHITGYGVGLSIVKRIVERLGGEVGVDCGDGKGCRFYFTLPVAETDSDFAEEG